MNCNPLFLLEDNNSNETHQNFGRGTGWFTSKDTIGTNASIVSLNFDNITLYNEGN